MEVAESVYQPEVRTQRSAFPKSPDVAYDLIVIGTGSGGLSIGLSMIELGFNVLFIEKNERNIGGECLNSGCVPSKALIHVAKLIHQAQAASGFGISLTGKADFRKVMDYVREKQHVIRGHENAGYFREKGIQLVIGTAEFAGSNTVQVAGQLFKARKIVLATGSSPRKLNVPGVEQVAVLTNETIFHLETLPERLLVIGGGPIGVELSQAFARIGANVTLVHNASRLLNKELPEISRILETQVRKEGIHIWLNTTLQAFPSPNEALVINESGEDAIIQFDRVLVATGRKFTFDLLKLSAAGIRVKDGALVVDDYLRTSNPNVYAIGDVAGKGFFSHAAEYQAGILVNNFLSPFKKRVSDKHFSWVTFTDPEVATFGLSENELTKRTIRFEKLTLDLKEDDRAVVNDYAYGKLILFITKPRVPLISPRILGGTCLCPNAGEIVQELILAMSANLGISKLFNKTYPYPTASRINKLIVLEKYRQSLTPGIRKLVRTAFAVFG